MLSLIVKATLFPSFSTFVMSLLSKSSPLTQMVNASPIAEVKLSTGSSNGIDILLFENVGWPLIHGGIESLVPTDVVSKVSEKSLTFLPSRVISFP